MDDAPRAGTDHQAVTGPQPLPSLAEPGPQRPGAALAAAGLASALARAVAFTGEPAPWAAPASRPLRVRLAEPLDEQGVAELVGRCSDEALYRRFHGAAKAALRRELRRITEQSAGYPSWVAVAGGDIRGVASLALLADGGAEVALLVEDAWQRQGVGRALLRSVARHATRRGVREIGAQVLGDNVPALRFFAAVAPVARRTLDHGVVDLAVPVPAAVPAPAVAPVDEPPLVAAAG